MTRRTSAWPRGRLFAAVALPILLGGVASAVYGVVGPVATIILVTVGNVLLVATLMLGAERGRRQAHDAVRTLEAIPHPLFVVDTLRPGQPNRFVNTAYTALTGYGAAEAVSDDFDAIAIFSDPAHVAALAHGLATSTTGRVAVRRGDGTMVGAMLELRAIPSSDGGRYLLGVMDPIENGQRAGDHHSGARLDPGPVGGEAAPRTRNAFLSWLTHELRSPLNACMMWLDVLALAPQADKLTQAVEAIKRNLARQTRLINDLSDAAKIQSADLEMQLAPLDLVALLNGHIDAWQLLAIGKQVAFEQRIEPAVALIDADQGRLLQALNQLLENAIACTPAGGRVQLAVRGGDNAWVVEVEDTGVGLSTEDAANLGAPLWRAPAAAKSRPGLGLGIAVAYHIARKHGGTLTATSKSSGVLFTLNLPLPAASHATGSSSTERKSER